MPTTPTLTPAQAEAALRARLTELGVHHDRVLRALAREGAVLAEEDDSDERGALLEAEALMERLEAHERAELALILGALDRLANGTWGTCAACGHAIPAMRLQALPWAERCATCAA